MKIAIPDRLPPKYVALFMIVMFAAQLIEGTDFLFAVLTQVYIGLWALAFNYSGGLEYPSGAFIFSNGLFSVVLGFGAKVVLGEPGERNMMAPRLTLLCYCAGMMMMALLAFLVRTLRPARGLLPEYRTLEDMKRASILSLIIASGLTSVLSLAHTQEGSLLSALSQLNGFPLMSIMLATTYEVRSSGGRKSVNWVVVVGIATHVVYGLIFFGKEGLLVGFLAWGIAASLNGYSFGKLQIAGMILGASFISYYLVPYSQYVRIYSSQSGSAKENLPIALEYLSDLNHTRQLYYETINDYSLANEAHLYDKREGLLDRLVQVAEDDELINFTDEGHIFGLLPTYTAYANIVPHILWPNKPQLNVGNTFAHEMGGLAEEDTTTGIAFSATADAFHQASWAGVLILMPIDLFLLFLILDSLVGSTRYSSFALLPVLQMFEQGAAGGLESPIHLFTYGVLEILFIFWITRTALPFVMRTVKPTRFSPLAEAPVMTGRSPAI